MSWVQLYIRCPHCGSGSQTYWEHHNCGSSLYINADARIECGDDHGASFMSWRWKCSGAKGFEKADSEFVNAALSELMRQLQMSSKKQERKKAIILNKAIGVLLQEEDSD
eukprot:263160_1